MGRWSFSNRCNGRCTLHRTKVFTRPPCVLHVVDNDDAGMKIYYLGNYIMKNA